MSSEERSNHSPKGSIMISWTSWISFAMICTEAKGSVSVLLAAGISLRVSRSMTMVSCRSKMFSFSILELAPSR